MNKLVVALLVGVFASVAAAQTGGPYGQSKEKQREVQSLTQRDGENSGNARATAAEQATNVKASKAAPKLSKEERANLAKDATKSNVNPENSSGAAATAAMQKKTTAASKATTRQNTEFKSKEGKQQLEQELQKNATP
jgi:hypothetical protein